jgi:hypothetical protein
MDDQRARQAPAKSLNLRLRSRGVDNRRVSCANRTISGFT